MKSQRQEKIKELIRKHEIETQEELAEFLQKAGHSVTQATVSRDIREMNLSKMAISGRKPKYVFFMPEEGGQEEKYRGVLKSGHISMEPAANILVIKTVAGMAMAVAAALDALKIPEVVGAVAGDDTILVATRNDKAALSARDKINENLRP